VRGTQAKILNLDFFQHNSLELPMIQRLSKIWNSFLHEDEAATTVEYAVMLMLVLLLVISAVQYFGDSVNDSFDDSSSELNGALGN
jgi:Flp pilus assembly pilin Flp